MLVVFALMAASAGAQRRAPADSSALPLAKNETEKRILAVQAGIVRDHKNYLSVPVQDGRALRLFAESAGAKAILEIGTSTGYSGLWFCLALQATGGHLTTLELDHGRATMAREHFRKAGVDNLVTVVEGDAHEQVTRQKGPFDVVFIDADKGGYPDYLRKVLPLVRPGGLILAHNIEMSPEYVKTVTSSPELETIFYMEGGGLGVTLKKR